MFFLKITQRVSWVSHTFIATNSFSQKCVCFSGPFHNCLVTNSLLYNPQKLCVFVFFVADVTCFSNHFNFPRSSLSNLFPPKSLFYSNPFIFKQDICKISSRYVLLTPFFIFPLKIMQKFSSRLWKLGIFRKWVEVLRFHEYFLKFFDWVVSHLLFVHLCWPIVAVWACIQAFFTVFLHCS